MSNIKLSIVIPNFNEKENLDRGVLTEVYNYLKGVHYDYEVLISDDGSTDGSKEIAEKFARSHQGFRVLPNPHGGKAKAVYAGIKAAKGEIVLFTDMDQSTPLKEVEKLLPWFDEGFDVVFGSRGKARENFPWYRQLTSWGFRVVRGIFLLRHVVDTQCGFKAFRTNVAKKLFPLLSVLRNQKQSAGWSVSAFDVELLFLAEKYGYRLKEVDVAWKDEDVATNKDKRFIKESTDMLKQILQVKKNDLQGKYDQK
ncbi:MAG: Glycosyl transferase family 2 [candidate division WWE3 bacterium GW2011_GWB1_42_6]|uniref:Glycosyl transferase family 2 n=1 Tax=candidate division WWE3 bacterium GW2011_GWB1_42_6 TaxID=1619115 RepID=A0A0G1AWP2_UNCKA|nr:MAG: Glycosyl transferase family 2 [candidate division WWE3 bacterium GW2011_GWB1_42_6]